MSNLTEMSLPETAKYSMQPFINDATITDLRWAEYNGRPAIEAVISEGVEVARLLHATSSKDAAGQRVTIYRPTEWEIEEARFIRVAM